MDFTPKTLPVNLEAEQAVLAAVLMDNRALESVSEFLLPEHFSHPAHQEIYKLALRQFAIGIPFDIITAKTYLEQQGILESVGGVEYLSKLVSAGSTVVNVEHYGRIVFDNARRRDLIHLGQDIIDDAYTEDLDKTVNTQIESAEQKLFNLASTGQSERNIVTLGDALKSALEEAEIAYKADGKLSGLTTGLDDLDKSISGLHHSDLIIIAGRPAMGKTAFALNIAQNVAIKENVPVCIFSLEMSASQLVQRMLCSYAEVDSQRLKTGNMLQQDLEKLAAAMNDFSQAPIYIDDTSGCTLTDIRTKCRRLKTQQKDLGLIVIDYLQLMEGGGKDDRLQQISAISRGLKILAKELDVPIITLSQLSRAVEGRTDKRPMLSDLRESGSIEQDADIVMFIYREDYYNKGESEEEENIKASSKGLSEVIIAKHRNGPVGTVKLLFQGNITKSSCLGKGYYRYCCGASY